MTGGQVVASLVAFFGGLVWWTQRASASPGLAGGSTGTKCNEDALRARVVEAARSQIGKPLLNEYLADAAPQYVGQHPEWCGIFALWAIHQAGIARDVQWKTALGFVEVEHEGGPAGRDFPRTSSPKAGDIAYYDQPYQHHAVVAAVRGDVLDVINGNGSGSRVTASSPARSKATNYYSIQKYVDRAVAEGCK